MSNDHDTGYKLLFSHPEMVRDLLTGFIPGEWIGEADFSTLERINASYVSENFKQRHDDVVWRVRLKDRWLWVYLVLEFQSEPDPWMALRMLVYVGLLAQDLVRRDDLVEGKLPPILPLVLYNGLPPWNAADDVGDLFAPSPRGLERFRPRMLYGSPEQVPREPRCWKNRDDRAKRDAGRSWPTMPRSATKRALDFHATLQGRGFAGDLLCSASREWNNHSLRRAS